MVKLWGDLKIVGRKETIVMKLVAQLVRHLVPKADDLFVEACLQRRCDDVEVTQDGDEQYRAVAIEEMSSLLEDEGFAEEMQKW